DFPYAQNREIFCGCLCPKWVLHPNALRKTHPFLLTTDNDCLAFGLLSTRPGIALYLFFSFLSFSPGALITQLSLLRRSFILFNSRFKVRISERKYLSKGSKVSTISVAKITSIPGSTSYRRVTLPIWSPAY